MNIESPEGTIRNLQAELESAKKRIELLQERIRELEELVITDGLTGLYNQWHFYNRLEKEVIRNRRQRHPLCLLFFDVDGLKSYNDVYGHSTGNDVLKAVAQSLSWSIRRHVDTGYRYGGDEFAAILPEVHADQVIVIAERINGHLQKTNFQDVTLSFGIAELGPEMDSGTLFEHADKAMYVAKSATSKIHIYGE
jgi:diguanylate cyclase (GGDEF)-like protein